MRILAWIRKNCQFAARNPWSPAMDLYTYLVTRFPSIHKFLEGHGIGRLSPVGSGAHGSAYTDGDKIVKFTDDSREAMASWNLIGKSVPGVNRIVDVKSTSPIPVIFEEGDEPVHVPFYVIIQEKVDTDLSEVQAKVANAFGDWYSGVRDNPPLNFYEVRREIEPFAAKQGLSMRERGADAALYQIISSINNLAKHDVDFRDVSAQNTGVNEEGKITLFDLGVSRSPRAEIQQVARLAQAKIQKIA